MPSLAKVFKSGNSQAVRLTKAFRFDVDQVEITREGDALILRPHVKESEPWANLKAALAMGMSDDFAACVLEGRAEMEMQDRDFGDLFT